MKKISAKRGMPCTSGNELKNVPHQLDSDHEGKNIKRVRAEPQKKLPDVNNQRRIKKIARSSKGPAGAESVFSTEPLIAYKYDHKLAQHEEVIFTVKTLLQLEKNDHQAELMKSSNMGVFGRETARPYVLGVVAAFSLAYERFEVTLAEAKWAYSVIEPYGIDASRNKVALATAKSVQLINMDTGAVRDCQSPWLNQGHTVEFSPDGKKLLVGSSGFDAVFEFDTTSGEVRLAMVRLGPRLRPIEVRPLRCSFSRKIKSAHCCGPRSGIGRKS